MEKRRAHIYIQGRVQGVFFRQNMKEKAQELGVFGWVRNIPQGRVEAVLEGDEKNVDKLIEWARRGPFLAKVKNLEVAWEEYAGGLDSFKAK